jgi:hypothetical protein
MESQWKPVRCLFFLEVFINSFSGPAMILAPDLTMRELLLVSGDQSPLPEEAAEVCRWFGCMIFAFGAVQLFRALNADARTLKMTLESFFVGDILYTTASSYWSWKKGIWSAAAIFNVSFSLVLGVARVLAICDISLALPGLSQGVRGAKQQ